MSKKQLEDTFKNIELIKDLYLNQNKAYIEISQILNLSKDVIRRFMKRNNIPSRKPCETMKNRFSKKDIENIINLYKNERLSFEEIGEIYKVDRRTISNQLKYNDVYFKDENIVSHKELKRRQKITKLNIQDEQLIDLYCNQNLTATDIAKRFNVTKNTVLVKLRSLNVSIRNLGELLKDKDFKEKHIKRMRDAITEETHMKIAKTNLERYGVDNPFKSKYFQNKAHETINKNGTMSCSRQQKYLCNLLNGRLNYSVSKFFLDIAFPDENIFCEYNGGFHDGCVQLKIMSKEDFEKKENKRRFKLRDLGWKEITIISKTDKLPEDNIIIEMIKFSKDYLNLGHHYIVFNIDTQEIQSSQFNIKYNFGNLRQIKEKDII